MKKVLLSCMAFLVAAVSFANDGIQFTEGRWKDILSKAKSENKLVFIDVYTSWCGPCKMMSAEVFPQKMVGDVFNASFVNYKIDAEKGEGIDIAKKFDVRAFPTYLFVNGDGELVYRVVGYMKTEAFLKEANIAIGEKNDPKPFVIWESEYNSGKKDKAFLFGYLKKRALLRVPSADLAEEVFPMLTKEELSNKEIMSSIIYFDPAIQFVPGGKVFDYVLQNFKELDSSGIVKYPLGIMEVGINNYFKKNIIENRIEKMLPVMIQSQKDLMIASELKPAEITAMEKELTMSYYSGVGNAAKTDAAAKDYVENGIMKLDIAGMQAEDAEGFKKFMEPYLTGKVDSSKDQKFAMKRLMKNNKMVSVSYNLRSAAEAVYKNSKDQKMLSLAAGWSRKADEFFPHFSSEAVLAGLLFKTGKKQEGIKMMGTAAKDPFLDMTPDTRKLLLSNVELMRKGEAPKDLWNKK